MSRRRRITPAGYTYITLGAMLGGLALIGLTYWLILELLS